MLVQTSLVHTAQVRSRKIAWDGREVVQHGLLSDYIALDLDAEWRECDRIQAVLAGAVAPSMASVISGMVMGCSLVSVPFVAGRFCVPSVSLMYVLVNLIGLIECITRATDS